MSHFDPISATGCCDDDCCSGLGGGGLGCCDDDCCGGPGGLGG